MNLSSTEPVIVAQLEAINVWQRGAQRAPHKPLLLLMALAGVLRGEARQQPYERLEEKLRALLAEFGPYRRSYHPEYPFWRLQNDGDFWEIPQRAALFRDLQDRKRSGDAPPTLLHEHHATGGFSQHAYDLLKADPPLAQQLVARLLQAHFPPSMHEAILDAVGMPTVPLVAVREARDPAFRAAIIRIYEHRCAICGFDGRLGFSDVALDAAHVMWRAAGGPDREDNGLALCALHHRLFDRGALSVGRDHRILVSQHVHGGAMVAQTVLQFANAPLRAPVSGAQQLAESYIAWHYEQVFRRPERQAAA